MTKTALAMALAPDSDQLVATDFIERPLTLKIRSVFVGQKKGKGRPPIDIYFPEFERPFKPCKTTGRLMMHVWGDDEQQWIGKRLTLYCDPDVMFEGKKVGGIRISHMSHMGKKRIEVALNRRIVTVLALEEEVTADELKEVLAKLREHLQTTEAIEAQAADLGVCGKVNSVSSWTREQLEAARAFIKSQQGPQQ